MTNTEAKGGEPWRLDDGSQFMLFHDARSILKLDMVTDRKYYTRIVACVNAFAGHDPSDSVVLSRERWEKINDAIGCSLTAFIALERHFTERKETASIEMCKGLIDRCRSALAAAERGRG